MARSTSRSCRDLIALTARLVQGLLQGSMRLRSC